jgi:hypothetical protein
MLAKYQEVANEGRLKRRNMYALINTMSSNDYTIGHIISRHKTLRRAYLKDCQIQRIIKKSSRNSYLPTIIVKLNRKVFGNLSREDYTVLTDDEYDDLMRLHDW